MKGEVDGSNEGDLNSEEKDELESEYTETEALKYIQINDIAVIKTGDNHPYYLLKLTSSPYVTTDEIQNDYGHIFPPQHKVMEGHYLEEHKIKGDSTIYYIDDKRKAIVSGFSVVGNCPLLPSTTLKRRGKDVEMYLINSDLHQALSELVNCDY